MENLVKLIALLIVMLMFLRKHVHHVSSKAENPTNRHHFTHHYWPIAAQMGGKSDEISEQANFPTFPTF